MPEELDLDFSPSAADWCKGRTWDIYPLTARALLDALGVGYTSPVDQKEAVKNFLKLRAAKAMPEEVRADLLKYGFDVPKRKKGK
jgi:hypothetical protein